MHIVHADTTALRQGVRAGQTVAEAKALLPKLVTRNDDPAANRRWLESLALWADRFSPIVHIEDDNTLFIDISGCDRLFPDESALLSQAIDGLTELGPTVYGAIADSSGAAWALAHASDEQATIAVPGQTAAHLTPLPVWSLRIDSKTVETLASIGVETIASLWHLPRSSLTSRFGEALLDRMDQALGDKPEPLTPYRPRPIITSRFAIGHPTTRIEVLTEAIHRALERFCDRLAHRAGGVRQAFVTFYCPNVVGQHGTETRTVTIHVDLSLPTRSARRLQSLLTVSLDRLQLPAPTDVIMIWAKEIDPLDDRQEDLFDTGSSDAHALSDLLDRLAVRLGTEAVATPRLLSEHQPERAFRYAPLVGSATVHPEPRTELVPTHPEPQALACEKVPVFEGQSNIARPSASRQTSRHRSAERVTYRYGDDDATMRHTGASPATNVSRRLPTVSGQVPPAAQENVLPPGPRPLRLMSRPTAIAVTSMAPDGPPLSFRYEGRPHAVVHSVGPERIETGWWRSTHHQRDYFRMTTEGGRRGWIFRDRTTGRWFLHGWFD